MTTRVSTNDPLILLVRDQDLSIVDGTAFIDMTAAGQVTTTDNVVNTSTLAPSPGPLTDALDGADTRIIEAYDIASAAQTDGTQALSNASVAQTTADQAQLDASTALINSAAALADAAAAQADATQALSDAGAAQTTANTALTAAGVAQVAAGTALSAANSALAGLALKADIASPALAGTPTTPTAPANTNTTQIASTGFVSTAISTAVPVGASGNVLVSNGTANVSTTISALFSNANLPQMFDLMTDPAVSGWARVLSGTGQLSSVSATTPSHPGQWQGVIGTGPASRAGVYLGPATGGLLVPSVSSVGFFEVMLRLNTISTGPSSFDTYVGFADEPASAAAFNGVYFYVSTLNILRARRNVGGVLSSDVAILTPTAGLWYRLRATYSAGNVVLSYAQTEDRTLALTTALTVPIVGLPQSPQTKLVRQTGIAAASITWDYLSYYLPKV